MTDAELTHIEEVARLDGNYHAKQLIAEVRRLAAEGDALRAERDGLRADLAVPPVLRPLTPQQIEDALNEGRAESEAARGNNAFVYMQRRLDRLREGLADAIELIREHLPGLEHHIAALRALAEEGK